jgi:thiamine biosynthesis lipoprotein
MMDNWSRRRVLSAVGGIGALCLLPAANSQAIPRWRWRGSALGAKASMILYHPDRAEVSRLVELALLEVERLERIFSLQRGGSELSRLNHQGRIACPSLDLVTLLNEAVRFSVKSDGAFDVTVQPLWLLYAAHFAKGGASPDGPSQAAIDAARARVDYQAIDVTSKEIRFAKAGMAITLNGIAQGYITDRVAELLRHEGLDQVLIDLGEIRALAAPPDSEAWQVSMVSSAPGADVKLVDRAVATSSPGAMLFDHSARFHHLFDPKTGTSAHGLGTVSVSAPNATMADALATTCAVVPQAATDLCRRFRGDNRGSARSPRAGTARRCFPRRAGLRERS